VVLIEYPRAGIWTLAFVTGAVNQQIQSQIGQPMLSVFIPTTPNPTTGWYAIIAESDVINLSLSIEDAFKVVISGGIVNPGSGALAPVNLGDRQIPPLVNKDERLQPITATENTMQ
jgi:uncharacterized membrane protein